MKNIFTTTITLIFFISLIKTENLKGFEINPNKLNNNGSISSNDNKKNTNDYSDDLEQFFQNTKPVTTFTSKGYLTISTLNRVISYPFSEKAFSVKVFYKQGLMMLKDQNNMVLWNYKFDEKNEKEEREILTFINRGNLLAQDAENQRIWPYAEEQLSKKLNISLSFGNLDISDENKHKIWSYCVKSGQVNNDLNFYDGVAELVRV